LKEFCCTLIMVKYPFPALLRSFLPTVLSYGRGNHTTPHMQLHSPLTTTAHSKCTSHIKVPQCLYIRDGQNSHLQHECLQSINAYNYYVNKINIILQMKPTWCTIFLSIFTSFLYMFRATMCPSSGETTVFMWHLVLVIPYG
jgi:hypothetical protein